MPRWPEISDDPLYQLLHNEDIKRFNQERHSRDQSRLRGMYYRGIDLREMNADGLDFSDAYFRNADLRGVDFRNTNLEGASMASANISGCYFPAALDAAEIRMSIELGTRLRYSTNK